MATRANADAGAGIRAVVHVGSPGQCPAAALSQESQSTVTNVARSTPDGDGRVVEDLTVESAADVHDEQLTEIYSAGSRRTYRFDRESDHACVCERVEELGVPLSEVQARDGALELTFFAADVEVIRETVGRLRGDFDDVSVKYLSRAGDTASGDLVMVDRDRLTDRQREVLETAYDLGYFEYPKGANAAAVADELGIATSTFVEHLSAAQSKLLDALLAA
jgi:hypothetical protein